MLHAPFSQHPEVQLETVQTQVPDWHSRPAKQPGSSAVQQALEAMHDAPHGFFWVLQVVPSQQPDGQLAVVHVQAPDEQV